MNHLCVQDYYKNESCRKLSAYTDADRFRIENRKLIVRQDAAKIVKGLDYLAL